MDLTEYQRLAQRTANPKLSNWEKIMNGCLGMCGESGECIDLIKKAEFQEHPFDRDKLLEEIGDVMWYVAETASGLGYTLNEVCKHNLKKLSLRYPEGFDAQNSIHRPEYEEGNNDE